MGRESRQGGPEFMILISKRKKETRRGRGKGILRQTDCFVYRVGGLARKECQDVGKASSPKA